MFSLRSYFGDETFVSGVSRPREGGGRHLRDEGLEEGQHHQEKSGNPLATTQPPPRQKIKACVCVVWDVYRWVCFVCYASRVWVASVDGLVCLCVYVGTSFALAGRCSDRFVSL